MTKITTSHSRRRGAALVEALIVISTFILLLIGAVFFKQLYVNTYAIGRAARGSALAYAMTGCGDNQNASGPEAWLGQDLGGHNADAPQSQEETTDEASADNDTVNSNEADDIMDSEQVSSSNGVNPITRVRIAGHTGVGIRGGLFSPDRSVFSQDLDALSYVSCSDHSREGSVAESIDYIWGMFSSIF